MKNLRLNTLDVMNVNALSSKDLLVIDGGHEGAHEGGDMVHVATLSVTKVSGVFDAAGAQVDKTFERNTFRFEASRGVVALVHALLPKLA